MNSVSNPVVNFFQEVFGPLITVLGGLMRFFHNTLGVEWWIAIALVTVVVRTVLFPLTVKQVRSMRAMQEIQPEIQKLKDKYKDNTQKLQEEQMKLFRERGVNPAAGCLPLLVQMPIFIGIFYTIRKLGGIPEGMIGLSGRAGTIPSFDTGGVLWFQNLTHQDPIYILPVLSAVTMLASMEMTNGSAQAQMRWVMRVFPFVFLFITIHFPAGLLIYLVTTNIMTLGQNYIIYNVLPDKRASSSQSSVSDGAGDKAESKVAAKAVANGSGGGGSGSNGSSSPNGEAQRSTRALNRSSKKKKSRKK